MPAALKEVRTRIVSVKNTQKITKAMKLVAASKLRRATDRIVQMRPYSTKLSEMLTNIISGTELDVPIAHAEERPLENVLFVIVTSDRGLCGGFNSNMVRLAKRTIEEEYSDLQKAGKISLMFVGKKGFDGLKRTEGANLRTEYQEIFKDLSFENAAVAAENVMDGFVAKEFDRVEVFYNQFKNQITQIPTRDQFLPIPKLEAPAEGEAQMKSDFIFEPAGGAIVQELVPKILKTKFYSYILDSNAAEHGARMTAMDQATDNAEELLKELKLTYNRARQAAITTEITEIVSGAAALNG